MAILFYRSLPVKPARRSPRPPLPFGWGLVEDADDGPDDATLELWAREAELEDRYMAAIEGLATCLGCGLPDRFIRESDRLCPPCALRHDVDEGLACKSCGEIHDDIDRFGYCRSCDDGGTDATIMVQTRLRRVY